MKDQEENEKASMILKSLKRKSKEEYDMESLTEEQISKSLKTNNGKALIIQREKKQKNL